jgi:hypothetical protein
MLRSSAILRRRIGLLLLGALVLGVPEYAIADVHDGDATGVPGLGSAVEGLGGSADERAFLAASGATSHEDNAEHGESPRGGHSSHVCHDGHAHGQTPPPDMGCDARLAPNEFVSPTSSALPPSRLNEPSLRPPIA